MEEKKKRMRYTEAQLVEAVEQISQGMKYISSLKKI
jgi:hypothetical protein